jgi:hypothetical protein
MTQSFPIPAPASGGRFNAGTALAAALAVAAFLPVNDERAFRRDILR